MLDKRRFADKLTGKGTAARLRESVSEALRESVTPVSNDLSLITPQTSQAMKHANEHKFSCPHWNT